MNKNKTAVWIDIEQHKKIKKMTLFDSVPEKTIQELICNLINEAIEARKVSKNNPLPQEN